MSRLSWKLSAVGLAVVFGLLVTPTANAAATPSSGVTQTVHYQGGNCQLKSDTPHWSWRAGTVLFKTRVECIGTSAPTVRITGTMNYSLAGLPGSPTTGDLRTVATSSQDQVVPIGKTATYYTPMRNTNTLVAPGTYQGVATGEVIAPQHSNLTTEPTQRVYVAPVAG